MQQVVASLTQSDDHPGPAVPAYSQSLGDFNDDVRVPQRGQAARQPSQSMVHRIQGRVIGLEQGQRRTQAADRFARAVHAVMDVRGVPQSVLDLGTVLL